MIEVGTILGHRYKIEEKIGAGGMAIVYKAYCNKLNRYVAIKVLREEFSQDQTFVANFKSEAQAAGGLCHSNIVNIYDVEEEGNIYYIVMEYIDGITLKKYISNNGPLNSKETIEIGLEIAKALQVAHKNNIIHRDIKPQNIMVTKDNKVKVTDFGIASAVTSNTINSSSNAIGSVHYFSPEQARGGYTDEKSDIYSLGITMYEMVTNTLPFQADSPVTVALQHIKTKLPSPKNINPNIWASLESIIIKATEKKTEDRYQTAKELIKDLEIATAYPNKIIVKEKNMIDSPTIKLSDDHLNQIREQIVVDGFDEMNNGNEISKKNVKHKSVNDKVVVVSAAVTSIAIIILLMIFGINIIKDKIKPQIEIVEVPKVVGMTVDDATKVLNELELSVLITLEEYTNVDNKGEIINQVQLANTKIQVGSVVEVAISKGKEPIEVPNLINQKYEDGSSKLKELDFNVEMVSKYNDEIPYGIIYNQEPEGKEIVDKYDTVTVFVSLGKQEKLITVPSVKNLSAQEAIAKIKNCGLVVGNTSYIESDAVNDGFVISQTVAGGERVKEGYVIDLAISKGKKKPEEKVIFIPDKLSSQQEKGVLTVILKTTEYRKSIFDGEVTHASFPKKIIIRDENAISVEVYLDGTLKLDDPIRFDEE